MVDGFKEWWNERLKGGTKERHAFKLLRSSICQFFPSSLCLPLDIGGVQLDCRASESISAFGQLG